MLKVSIIFCQLQLVLAVFASLCAVQVCNAEVSVGDTLQAMRDFESRFVGANSWQLEHRQVYEYLDPEPGMSKERKGYYKIARRGSSYSIYRKIEERDSGQWVCWHDQSSVSRSGGTVTILPDYSPQMIDMSFYTNALFLNVTPQNAQWGKELAKVLTISSPHDAYIWGLPRSIESKKDEYTLRPTKEVVDGKYCVVIERENKDVIYLDDNLGFACRKRIIYTESGSLFRTFKNKHFRRIEGVWLPGEQIVTFYNSIANTDDASKIGTPHNIERNYLVSFTFTPPSDDAFIVPFPKHENAHVVDAISGKSYQLLPDGATPQSSLEHSIAQAMADDPSDHIRISNTRHSLILLNIALITALFLMYRIKSQRKKQGSFPASG